MPVADDPSGEANEEEQSGLDPGPQAPRRWRRILARVAIALALILLAMLGYLWATRDQIAGNVIQARLREYGIPGTYEIVSIGPRRQVLRNVVIGDPARPDLTVERVEVFLSPSWGLPRIGAVRLVRPRLYGQWRDGRMSLGSLDRFVYERKTTEPTRLPDIDLTLEDGRGRFLTPFGPIGAKAQGKGNLAGGFDGVLGAIAPALSGNGCRTGQASLFGRVTTGRGRPRLEGPLRVAGLDCPQYHAGLTRLGLSLDVRGDRDLKGVKLRSGVHATGVAAGSASIADIQGRLDASVGRGRVTGGYDLSAARIASPAILAARLRSSGSLRSRDGFATFEWQGDLAGNDLRPGPASIRTMEEWRTSGEGTLLAPIVARIATALRQETSASRLSADFTLRRKGDQFSLVVPSAFLRGRSGATLLSLSRVQAGLGASPRITGNFSTGGAGLPRLSGYMEQLDGRDAVFHLAMPEYVAGSSRIALPELMIVQKPGGATGFAGRVLAEGALPGGTIEGLELPLSGSWSAVGGLAMWPRCTTVRFGRLRVAQMELLRRDLVLCPSGQAAIVQSGPSGLRVAARMKGLDLVGRLGESPLRIRGGAVAIHHPGTIALSQLDVALGPPQGATRLAVAHVEIRQGKEWGGRFSGADFGLFAVPIDIRNAEGQWRYANGALTLAGDALRVEDRQKAARFQPLIARDAQLSLAGNIVTAQALLREPTSDRAVTRLTLRHDLGTGAGHADLDVEGLQFDSKLQPDMLSRLVLGVVANAAGTVTGKGEIAWDAKGVRSSGSFGSNALDFAAAFGPAKGVAGTIHFIDLLNLTTAPNQRITIKSINPGIEVFDGTIGYELTNGEVLSLHDARWPFLGGTLTMEPVALRIGVAETRRYVLQLDGIEASQFVERMELSNLSATGSFDGTIPLVFDENGGRIDHGVLRSRPPGGNLSYVGALTYKDLSAMANFAFDALRSLDYRQMRVELDGPLTGEIVTRVLFDGIKQGQDARRNILTKQIAKLPIRFNVNIHAPFYQLITSVKSMYDPAFVRDPRDLGLLDKNGNPVDRPQLVPGALLPGKNIPDESGVQHAESETKR